MSETIDLTNLLVALDDDTLPEGLTLLRDAIDNASDQDRSTWLAENGKRIAAIVPVDVAERDEQRYGTGLSDAELEAIDDHLELQPGTTGAVVEALVTAVLGKTTHNGPPFRPVQAPRPGGQLDISTSVDAVDRQQLPWTRPSARAGTSRLLTVRRPRVSRMEGADRPRLDAGDRNDWIAIAQIAQPSLNLTPDQRISLLATAIEELGIFQGLMIIHGIEHAAQLYREAGGHIRFSSAGEPMISLAAAGLEEKGKRS